MIIQSWLASMQLLMTSKAPQLPGPEGAMQPRKLVRSCVSRYAFNCLYKQQSYRAYSYNALLLWQQAALHCQGLPC